MICLFKKNLKQEPNDPGNLEMEEVTSTWSWSPPRPSRDDEPFENDTGTEPGEGNQIRRGTVLHSKDEHFTKNVEKRMIKSTNLILAISLMIIALLINIEVMKTNADFKLTKHGDAVFFNRVSILQIITLNSNE